MADGSLSGWPIGVGVGCLSGLGPRHMDLSFSWRPTSHRASEPRKHGISDSVFQDGASEVTYYTNSALSFLLHRSVLIKVEENDTGVERAGDENHWGPFLNPDTT